jgi:cobalt/nickel transport system permease protein
MAEGVSARARLVVVLVLGFGISAIKGFVALPLAAALVLGLVLALGQGRVVRARMRGAALLGLGFILVLPLTAGETVLAQFGPLALRLEGLQAGALIAGRLLAIVGLSLALLAPLSPFQLVAGLRGLGVPALMADLALLTLRYLEETRAELARMRLARRLRGGDARWGALPDQAMMLAGALIRAQGRADRLWAALRLRGYGAGLALPAPALRTSDRAAMLAACCAALALVMLDHAQ